MLYINLKNALIFNRKPISIFSYSESRQGNGKLDFET